MKNAKKIVLAALMVAAMAFALCACGSKNVDGTYVVYEVNGSGVDEALEGAKEAGMELTAEQLCSFKLSGGNVTVSLMGMEKTGTYEVDGTTLKITLEGQTANATIEDGVITFNNNGQTMKCKK